MMTYADLSDEQRALVDHARAGRNVLVDACIGSGKTTAIQVMCASLPPERRILYLTYNKLLKADAKEKIVAPNVRVTNYHGFAMGELCRRGVFVSVSRAVAEYDARRFPTERYDVLVLDEYQDIDEEVATMLWHIKHCNPGVQIVAVGDMSQKIYDKTRLDAAAFVISFLGTSVRMEFTRCFRLSRDHAAMLGRVWGKQIDGVNHDCHVSEMSYRDALKFLLKQSPGDLLCLGMNTGWRSSMLNDLERLAPDVFNKTTVWSNVSEHEGATEPGSDCAIFTTYDGCKGMERDVCVVFDWSEDYWSIRASKPNVRYEILRNIFCVAASRGKRRIIFVRAKRLLDERTLSTSFDANQAMRDVAISSMFDFKFSEDVDAARVAVDVRTVTPAGSPIFVPTRDGYIDLSFCVGIYQEAAFFEGCAVERYVDDWFYHHPDESSRRIHGYEAWPLDSKILYLASLETRQNRYLSQVPIPLVSDEARDEIVARLGATFRRDDRAQVECGITFVDGNVSFRANGFADVVRGGAAYELKFVSELSREHVLQCACYVVALNLPRGFLMNTRTGETLEVTIPDRRRFLDAVAVAVTKGVFERYDGPSLSAPPAPAVSAPAATSVPAARPVATAPRRAARKPSTRRFDVAVAATDVEGPRVVASVDAAGAAAALRAAFPGDSFSGSRSSRAWDVRVSYRDAAGKTRSSYFVRTR